MSDLIKREDAIDAINKFWINGTSLCEADKLTEEIINMPSANQWIPCSERLPEEGKEVLVTIWDRCEIAFYNCASDGLKEWEFNDFSLDGEDFIDVTAWMPLPELYREEQ